jgi:hypothetical protein
VPRTALTTPDELELKTLVDDIEYWETLYNQQPASLTVSRTSEEDFKDRQLILTLDGQRLGVLMFGESLTQDLEPGPHRLRISNTFVWKTIHFEVKLGEQVRFEAINRPGKLTYPMLTIMGVGPLYLTVRRLS